VIGLRAEGTRQLILPAHPPVMARSFRSPLLSLATVILFAWTTSALHFYMDLKDKRCFIEELPTDTVVEGMRLLPV
jgi:hypothetical protein